MASTTSSNPWKSNNDPKDYVGCKIEIISNSDIRYVGTLYTFDPHASTISLKDVHSYGTETRRSGDQVVAPSSELYEYIVFRISDIKDLVVCEPPSPNSRRLSHVDSAIVSASDEAQQTRSSGAGYPRIRYAPEFVRSMKENGSSWNENRGRSGSANNGSLSSGNLGSVGGNNNRGPGQQQGNARNGANNNNTGYSRGGSRGGRGGNRGGMMGGSRGGYNNGNRRGAPVFPYPNQAGPQDWLTRYQKDMNLKAEFQNVNPDLSVLANIASSTELPADKVRDMMEGNWEAFLTAAELPGKTEKAPSNVKAEFKDGFFDSLTAPPPNPSDTMYNRRKDYETFGPANNNNNNGAGNNGRYNNRQNNQQSGQNQQQQSTQTGRWGNQGSGSNQQRQQSNDGYGQNNAQGYGGRNGGGQQGSAYNNGGRFGGGANNNRTNQRGRGGNQRGGYVNQRGGQRGFGGNLNTLLGSMNNGGGFTQRDLVIPAASSNGGGNSNNWTFNQRTQAALWTPAVGLDLTQQPTASPTWTFACNSPSISENGYDALSPSPVA